MSKPSSVRTRKRGKTWSYIFEAGKTAEGKRKVVEKGGYPTKQTAYDAGVAAYTDRKHGNIGITSEKVTVKDFMTNLLENVVALNVKQTAMQIYISLFDNHIVQSLGNNHALDYAVYPAEIIKSNPASYIKVPKKNYQYCKS